MIDIGVNLTSSRFDKDRDDVVARAKEAGISAMVLTGTDLVSSPAAAALASQYSGFCYSTAGVHPHDAKMVEDLSLPSIRTLAELPQVVAIGECGLDFNRDFSPRPQQEAVFEAQLKLAAALNMPVFLHCRDAHARFMAILTPWLDKIPAAVLHCFTGSEDELKECLDAGLYIGITGWVCDERRGEALREIVPLIPDDKILIETDAPYLLPRDLKPKPKSSRNEPRYLPHIAKEIALLRQQDAEQLITHSINNSRRFFGL
ncbi:3'-5' ssDNA/RNA exonuclease TatD [Enterovibrio nigricans]|uniref:TatD DNase family protein n=1 Tax=Enterovibrio nigricans DSM 22720 TaxID=1121868 RepID=A0A1T4U9X9_9GAMM|nr:3'-5' ssDNA/RNA exonuclease TatD [Enterovibrio nigricans]PKF49712.1 3'-5' ssDNA/RNA exonuclease TatD [Enterovibrio nigricans]SKA49406.1 TatD DNase family protein [Enterovibrio nigricans DSM 22720]